MKKTKMPMARKKKDDMTKKKRWERKKERNNKVWHTGYLMMKLSAQPERYQQDESIDTMKNQLQSWCWDAIKWACNCIYIAV
jgi:hypothetical protein